MSNLNNLSDISFTPAYMRLLTQGRFRWQISHDQDYGIDHRSGYSLTLDGRVVSEFEPSLADALAKGFEKAAQSDDKIKALLFDTLTLSSGQPHHLTDIEHCARCGNDHAHVLFRPYQHEMIDHDGTRWPWWALCPTTGEPILMREVLQPRGTISYPLPHRDKECVRKLIEWFGEIFPLTQYGAMHILVSDYNALDSHLASCRHWLDATDEELASIQGNDPYRDVDVKASRLFLDLLALIPEDQRDIHGDTDYDEDAVIASTI